MQLPVTTPYVKPLTAMQKRCIDMVEKYGFIVRYSNGKWAQRNAPLVPGSLDWSWQHQGGARGFELGTTYGGVGMGTVASLLKLQLLEGTRQAMPPGIAFYPVECKRTNRVIESTKFSII